MKKLRFKKSQKLLKRALVVGLILWLAFYVFQLCFNIEEGRAINIYFVKGDSLIAVERPLLVTEAPLNEAIRSLLAGPEQEGLSTLIPKGTKALSIKQKDHLAIINFNNKLEEYGGGSARVQGMVAQIVYTATDIPGIDKVQLLINGKEQVVLGGEGFIIDKPLSRKEVSN
ncbi:hypothetical protein A2291_03845 [candidate division WOR-1 bacterium RIFOXYB2_FULL_42_35]|uniref:GerMN domain-containing protein n=1 Tax=candidate division WOR-1 bacterium RIFOXYC2_FULL_41_25 TaxID=1802586 RepID=A0A1F4TJL1_UNCSA|nr:MAG: hypothetical protein A2247_06055 [candidate division WOR-1 bacterium RIFOXYA2_FULL_41_14]OGC21954.1 MAG: hypothetical protein A2291_03845 [candidate division WOR-1 bacterium RIFOXYB2_FULL_42_35]OGC32787.1 MAG: hypothetical protein A2462_07100 [candidate division WOR-1 bacterium RIFOXYC2_FULL_41_25]OGC41345.1 MAG: hypothetical protein A2548_02075 [candidate division WOR-1 bacterium RIFOXYD2_FULL_41_8]